MSTSPDGLTASQVSVSQRSQNKVGKVLGREKVFSAGLSSCIPSKVKPTVQATQSPRPALDMVYSAP